MDAMDGIRCELLFVIDRNRKRRDKPQACPCRVCIDFVFELWRVPNFYLRVDTSYPRSVIRPIPILHGSTRRRRSRLGRRCDASHSSHDTRLATGHRTRHIRYPHVRTCASRPWSYLRSDAHDTYQGESPLSSQARHCLSPPHPSAADCDSRLIASRRRSASRRHRHRRTREPSLTSSSR